MSVEAPTDPEATVNETVGPIAAAIESGLLPGRVFRGARVTWPRRVSLIAWTRR